MSWTQARDASVEGARGRRRRSRSRCSTSIPPNRRISLGLKQTEPNPWEMVRINHPVGSHIKGKVKSITDFGIFVGVEEGIDGLVHVSDLHWTKKVKHPSELFKKGDDVEAVVLGIDVDNERISLGVKQLAEDPWSSVPDALSGRRRACAAPSPASPTSASSSRSRKGIEGPDPRLAALHRAGRQAGAALPRRRRVEAEVTQRRRARAPHRRSASRRCAGARSATRSTAYLRREREGAQVLVRGHPERGAATRSRRRGPARESEGRRREVTGEARHGVTASHRARLRDPVHGRGAVLRSRASRSRSRPTDVDLGAGARRPVSGSSR